MVILMKPNRKMKMTIHFCGEVQEKGDVASLWCLMSHTILTAHRSIHSPMKMHGVTPGMVSTKNNDAFVNDTDGYTDVERRSPDSEKETVSALQKRRNPGHI